MALITAKVKQVWQEIEKEIRRLEPEYADQPSFLPPAQEKEVLDVERRLNVRLPDDYRASLQMHEGTAPFVWLWDAVSIAPLNVCLKDRATFLEEATHPSMQNVKLKAIGPVAEKLFDTLWLPVASDNGVPICLDLHPNPGGNVGQMIYVDWEDGTVRVIANSFLEFLEVGLKKLQSS